MHTYVRTYIQWHMRVCHHCTKATCDFILHNLATVVSRYAKDMLQGGVLLFRGASSTCTNVCFFLCRAMGKRQEAREARDAALKEQQKIKEDVVSASTL